MMISLPPELEAFAPRQVENGKYGSIEALLISAMGVSYLIDKIFTILYSQNIMRKQTILYTSPLDALIAVTKRLSLYENTYKMDSEEFFYQYNQGQLSDEASLIDWANDYRHYLGLHQALEKRLQNAA